VTYGTGKKGRETHFCTGTLTTVKHAGTQKGYLTCTYLVIFCGSTFIKLLGLETFSRVAILTLNQPPSTLTPFGKILSKEWEETGFVDPNCPGLFLCVPN